MYRDTHSVADTNLRGQNLGLSQDIINETDRGSKQYDADMARSREIGVRTADMVRNGTDFAGQVSSLNRTCCTYATR
nr:hypothetical protein [uncultured Lichenicoccus sp.]